MLKKKWTFIVFINGENNLLPHAITAYNELASVGSSETMNVIAFIDFPTFYIDDGIKSDEYNFLKDKNRWGPALYYVKKGKRLDEAVPKFVQEHWWQDELYDTKNLTQFVKLAVEKYPAEHYAFAYKSHGGQTTDIINKFIEFRYLKLREDELVITLPQELPKDSPLKLLTYGLVWPSETSNKRNLDLSGIDSFSLKNSDFTFRIPFNTKKQDLPVAEAVKVAVYVDQEKVLRRFREHNRYLEKYWELALDNALIPDENKPYEVIIGFMGVGASELTFEAFSEAVKAGFGGQPINIFILDCCWGMSLDMAALFSGVCDYYVASADESPAKGIGYDVLLKSLSERPGEYLKPAELARMIPATFYSKRYDDYLNFDDLTDTTFFDYGVSCTTINKNAFLGCAALFTQFCHHFTDDLYNKKGSFSILKHARNKCLDFTYDTNVNYYAMYNIDLIWLLENIIYYIEKQEQTADFEALKETCYKLILCLRLYLTESFVGNNYHKADLTIEKKQRECKGISLIFPETVKQFERSFYSIERIVGTSFSHQSGWETVLKTYYSLFHK